ncbi:ATP-binding protein [Streptomyces sp. NPDC000229]|uniref:ATP-binding protein n=1 Tax=Streptomyces sp. NPDC000229 TaxID=3154247 RepID=UPI003324B07A
MRTETASPPAALVRAELRHCLIGWHLDALVDDALLIVTELVSNAVRHGAPPVSVRIRRTRDEDGQESLLLEVEDTGPGIDVAWARAHWRHPSYTFTEGGRGLFIVNALADSWGDTAHARGHTTWARLTV